MKHFSGRVAFVTGGASGVPAGRGAFEDRRRAMVKQLRGPPVKE